MVAYVGGLAWFERQGIDYWNLFINHWHLFIPCIFDFQIYGCTMQQIYVLYLASAVEVIILGLSIMMFCFREKEVNKGPPKSCDLVLTQR